MERLWKIIEIRLNVCMGTLFQTFGQNPATKHIRSECHLPVVWNLVRLWMGVFSKVLCLYVLLKRRRFLSRWDGFKVSDFKSFWQRCLLYYCQYLSNLAPQLPLPLPLGTGSMCKPVPRPPNILLLGFGIWCTWQNINWCRDWKGGTWRPRSKEKSHWGLVVSNNKIEVL